MLSWFPCRPTPPGLHVLKLAASSGACVRCGDHTHTLNCVQNNNNKASIPSVPLLFVSPFTMDLSWQPSRSAAQRRRGRRLRAARRHEQQSIAQALAVYTHHSAPRRQTMARAGAWVRDEVHGQVLEEPTPQAAGTEYFSLDVEDVPAARLRPGGCEQSFTETEDQSSWGSGVLRVV